MTLEGTNTYLYGADPCLVIDPGTDDPGHLEAIRAAAAERGGIGTVLVTHSHGDHITGADRLDAPVVQPAGGEQLGGLRALATPGHAADHVAFLTDDGVCFSGDLVLGLGSTIVPPGGNSLAAFIDSLALLAALDSGERSRAVLLTAVWDDVPPELLPMAAMAMEAHLEKLESEARLPSDLVE